ncbi:hypothetical protein LV779_19180 [Streptomyces thinghirensis]|nr:hypothetical protein [Streptomyces thinghirensis]
MVGLAAAVLIAGYDVTSNNLGNQLYALLSSPSHLRQLRDDPALVPQAVEEMLQVHQASARGEHPGWRPGGRGTGRGPDQGRRGGAALPDVGEPGRRRLREPGHDGLHPHPQPAPRLRALGRTTASAPSSPAWSCNWRSRPCCAACPVCGWRYPPTRCRGCRLAAVWSAPVNLPATW